jgi:AcrR family transcriptional regulator
MLKPDQYRFSRRHAKKVVTHDRIVTTARRLFREQGYDGVSMRSLAVEIGMSTGALFGHFESKEKIWEAAIGGPPPNYKLAEQIALLQGGRPGVGWIVCGRPDGQFEAHAFGASGDRFEVIADTPEEAVSRLVEKLPKVEPDYSDPASGRF